MKSLNLLLASKIAFYLAIFIYPISYVQNQETNTSKDLADSIAQFTAKLYSKSKNQTASKKCLNLLSYYSNGFNYNRN